MDLKFLMLISFLILKRKAFVLFNLYDVASQDFLS